MTWMTSRNGSRPYLQHRTIVTDTICHGGIPGRKIIESLLCERSCAGSGPRPPTCGKTSSADRVLVQPAAMYCCSTPTRQMGGAWWRRDARRGPGRGGRECGHGRARMPGVPAEPTVVRLTPAWSASSSCDRPRCRRSWRSRWPSRMKVCGWAGRVIRRTGLRRGSCLAGSHSLDSNQTVHPACSSPVRPKSAGQLGDDQQAAPILLVILRGPFPGAALVGDFHPHAATVHFGTDAEMAAWFTGSAVDGGVRDQLREAQDGVVRSRVAVQYPGQELACLPDLRGSGGESTGPADQRGRGGLTHAFSRSFN